MGEYARKRIHNGCLVQIENSVSKDNWTSLLMPNSGPRDGSFNTYPHLTIIKGSYNLEFTSSTPEKISQKQNNISYMPYLWDNISHTLR